MRGGFGVGAVPVGEPALVEALRADLEAAEFTVDAVAELLGPVASAALHREQALPALLATDPDTSATATLLRAFVLGVPVRRERLDAALARVGTDGAERLGLVRAAGPGPDDDVHAAVDLRPLSAGTDGWIASDLGEMATGGPLRADHVLGVGGASITLAQVTLRTPRRRTLDLGTGCGIQALHAARHSDTVVATDVSRRALGFAAFNAALAGVRLDLRHGSMLEPVRGTAEEPAELFDLVVSNPPFVITPRSGRVTAYEYRDAGMSGDDVVRDLVIGIGEVLEPGGVAQMLGNWEHRRGQDWRERVGAWVDTSGLDAWVVERDVQDPAEYAETWLRDGGTTAAGDPGAWSAGYEAWLDDFAARDVEAVGFGLVLLRRPLGPRPTLRRLEELTGPVRQPLGEHLSAALDAHDWAAAHDDEALLASRLQVAPDVTEERHLVPGAVDPTVLLLRQGDGFGRAVRPGTLVAGVVGACDGDLTLGQICGGIAALLEVRVDDVRREVVPAVRELLGDGMLRVVV